MKSHCPETLHTTALIEQVSAIRQVLEQHSDIDSFSNALLDQWLLPICAVSPYILRSLQQFPDILHTLIKVKRLAPRKDHQQTACDTHGLFSELGDDWNTACAVHQPGDSTAIEALQLSVLRQFRHRHMVRILWCDLTEVNCLEQTLRQLSLLAQACVQAADQWTFDALEKRFGVPTDDNGRHLRLIILGMGKLGGYELNVSSDIDIICVYPSSGVTSGNAEKQKSLDNGEFFRRCVQRICKLLGSVTAEGFVYRVDTRLRPFGESGPLVINFDGLEKYYLTQARDWERYAMVKARPLCGDANDIEELEQLVQPFIYRRYLDYAAFESMRELKRKIALSLLQKQMIDNIKLGSGGIREVEFIGQAFQLVRGGRESRLRIRPIVQVLDQLAQLQLLGEDEVQSLLAAYRYLRRVENGIQMMRDEQAHVLPTNDQDKQRLLCILDETDWPSFKATLAKHQANVASCFSGLFESSHANDALGDSVDRRQLEEARDLWAALGAESTDDESMSVLLRDAGYEPNDSLLTRIRVLCGGSFYQRLAAGSQQRLESIVPLVLLFAKETHRPATTLERMLELIRAVAGRAGYLQVLCDRPEALKHLLSLFSKSRWLAGFVVRQPIVIDELLTQVPLQHNVVAVINETQEFVQRLQKSELDVQMDSLRHYRQARQMRIAAAQLDGSLSLMQVSDQLSWLAQAIIEGVILLVKSALVERFGEPGYQLDGETQTSHVGVLAYGKLGGLELGFGSDLDLVFVHDSHGTRQLTQGKKQIENAVFYARLAQKFVHFMSTTTPAGVLYEIDLRLRPNGSSGVLVTGIDAFAQYQQSEAWTWEHQALMRARMVIGHPDLCSRFAHIRQQILGRPRPPEELRVTVSEMRERMRQSLGNTKAGLMHLKQDTGGVADIEFIVQYLVLANAHEHPELLIYTDNIRVLECVENLALLSAEDCRILRQSYINLRERLHRLALDENSPLVSMDQSLQALCDSVTHLREKILG